MTLNAIVKPKHLSIPEFIEWENQQETTIFTRVFIDMSQ